MAAGDNAAECAHNTHASCPGEVSEPSAASESATAIPECPLSASRRAFSSAWRNANRDIAPRAVAVAVYLVFQPVVIWRKTEATLVGTWLRWGLGALAVHAVSPDIVQLGAVAARGTCEFPPRHE